MVAPFAVEVSTSERLVAQGLRWECSITRDCVARSVPTQEFSRWFEVALVWLRLAGLGVFLFGLGVPS
jgi:hypothetical protein